MADEANEKKGRPATIHLNAGDIIITQGEKDERIFLLKKGHLNVYVKKDDANKKVGEIQAGELFGEMAFVDKKPRSATVVAAVESDVLIVTASSFSRAIVEQPEWLQQFIKTLIKRLRQFVS